MSGTGQRGSRLPLALLWDHRETSVTWNVEVVRREKQNKTVLPTANVLNNAPGTEISVLNIFMLFKKLAKDDLISTLIKTLWKNYEKLMFYSS